MADGKRILIGGGVRCGKSAFAVSLARQLGGRRAFVATAQGLDAEMCDRINRHQQERGTDFITIEEPIELAAALRELADVDVVVIDCQLSGSPTCWCVASMNRRSQHTSTSSPHWWSASPFM
jgi:adenosyl cobinamide kinase/adenosyl cobinamide phosphate guanylyltransferase